MFETLSEWKNRKLKENKKKGFTLVELIVVLVIIAILAALLIPALTGYINKAKEKTIVAETRQCVMAAQTLVSEKYGTLDLSDTEGKEYESVKISKTDEAGKAIVLISHIEELTEVPEGNLDSAEVYDGKIIKLVYKTDGKTCTYEVKNTGIGTNPDYLSKGTYEVK